MEENKNQPQEINNTEKVEELVEIKGQTLGGMVWNSLSYIGGGIYSVLYETGGFFADFFGITRPRYEYALRDHYENQREEYIQEKIRNGELDEWGNEIVQNKEDEA